MQSEFIVVVISMVYGVVIFATVFMIALCKHDIAIDNRHGAFLESCLSIYGKQQYVMFFFPGLLGRAILPPLTG